MIAVIGGTGTTGQHVVARLAKLGADFRCIVRDQESARAKIGGDVALVTGDISDAASIEAGCRGCDTLFLLTAHSPVLGQQQSDAIDAAKRAGVKKIVKLAGMMTNPDFLIPGQHGIAETHLRESGNDWTIVRPCFFMQNLFNAAGAVKEMGKMIFPFPADVPIGMIDVRDSADVCALALTEAGHGGKIYELTGAQITLPDAAAALSAALGKEIPYVQAPVEKAQQMIRDQGAPEWAVEHVGNIVKDLESGNMSRDTGQVEELLGRTPRTIDQFASDFADKFRN